MSCILTDTFTFPGPDNIPTRYAKYYCVAQHVTCISEIICCHLQDGRFTSVRVAHASSYPWPLAKGMYIIQTQCWVTVFANFFDVYILGLSLYIASGTKKDIIFNILVYIYFLFPLYRKKLWQLCRNYLEMVMNNTMLIILMYLFWLLLQPQAVCDAVTRHTSNFSKQHHSHYRNLIRLIASKLPLRPARRIYFQVCNVTRVFVLNCSITMTLYIWTFKNNKFP